MSTDMTALPLLIINIVFDYFRVPLRYQRDKTRKREIVQARQISMFFLRKFTGLSEQGVGNYFGKDHATVIHSIKVVNNLYDTDKCFRHDFIKIKEIINKNKTLLEMQISKLVNDWHRYEYYDTDNV